MKFENRNNSKFKKVTDFEAKHIALDLPDFQFAIKIMISMFEELDNSMQILEVEPYLEILFYKEKIDFNIYKVTADAYIGFENLSNKKYVKSIASKIDTSEDAYKHFKQLTMSHFFSDLEEIESLVQAFFEEEIMKKTLSDIYESKIVDIPCSFTKKILNKYLRISEKLFHGEIPTEHLEFEEFLILNNLIQKLVETNKRFPMFLYTGE